MKRAILLALSSAALTTALAVPADAAWKRRHAAFKRPAVRVAFVPGANPAWDHPYYYASPRRVITPVTTASYFFGLITVTTASTGEKILVSQPESIGPLPTWPKR